MNLKHIASVATAVALTLALGACGKPSSYGQEVLDEASGVKVTAENAASDSTATTADAITVEDGGLIIISPFTEKGSFHVNITSADGSATVFDDDVEGKVMFTVEAAPGTYNVTTSGNKVTGWMTIFAQNAQELEDENNALIESLEAEGVDASILSEDGEE